MCSGSSFGSFSSGNSQKGHLPILGFLCSHRRLYLLMPFTEFTLMIGAVLHSGLQRSFISCEWPFPKVIVSIIGKCECLQRSHVFSGVTIIPLVLLEFHGLLSRHVLLRDSSRREVYTSLALAQCRTK